MAGFWSVLDRALRQITSLCVLLLFPRRCVVCRALGERYLCETCTVPVGTIEPKRTRACKEGPIREIWSLGWYGDPVWRRVIEAWKYVGDSAAKDLLAKWLEQMPFQDEVIFTWVPLHPKKERARGFDQARWIAEQLGRRFKRPVVSLLERVVHKGPRARSGSGSRDTLDGVYRIAKDVHCPRCVVLCDDVRTTGETLDVCAELLKKAGTQEVIGCVLVESGRVA